MKIVIQGIGTALPECSIDQSDAAYAADLLRRVDQSHASEKKAQMLSILYRRSGVKKRHCVLLREKPISSEEYNPLLRQTFYTATDDPLSKGPTTKDRMGKFEEAAPEIAHRACFQALLDAQISAKEITHLVTVSCSGFAAPGFDLQLYDSLGLSQETARTHVGFMGCHGFLNGLRVARAYAASQPEARVLVCAVELCTLHHQYTDDPQQIVANSLFADGSAAFIVQQENPDKTESAPCYADFRDNGSCRIPNTEELMSWRIGNHGFEMSLSAQVPEHIQRELKPWVVRWLSKNGLRFEDVRHWAIHPGGPRILSASAEALGLPMDAIEISSDILANFGNMSSPTIGFILDRMRREKLSPPIVALAFGPGLVVEAALFC